MSQKNVRTFSQKRPYFFPKTSVLFPKNVRTSFTEPTDVFIKMYIGYTNNII